MKMVLKTLSVGELRSLNSTAIQHNRHQRKKARALFSEHGIVVPIIVNEHMRIIDGILRFEIAKELGLQELNAVVVSGAREEELLQLELSFNRLAEDGAWDTERLKSKFEQLIEYNVDLTFTGFETAEIDNILSFEVIEPEDQDWTASDPVTLFGDIWRVGDHIIACGNALSPDEVLGDVLDSLELAKACITDPPYNVPTVGHIRTTQKHAEFAMAAGEMINDPTNLITAVESSDVVYFSGITLAILDIEQRTRLLNILQTARANGKMIAFDPNLRPRLWRYTDEMTKAIMQGAAVSDLVMPSFEDEADWFNDASPQDTSKRYFDVGAKTVVVKNGSAAVHFRTAESVGEIPAKIVEEVVDTTAAGDSFNAEIIAGMFNNGTLEESIERACQLAAFVVQGRGALVSIEHFKPD